ncbi:Protein of unknown function [Pyronema omphalodes CBS 100304]|uniref:Uncharacterized protein n=1 Tax=Pyronema omphalodes (strain CBS 100304) TaxID=1076935 RepID=U4LPX6_PYROM|nr:Protein of unknown function [Pyronema omphalodes CBS 100304]
MSCCPRIPVVDNAAALPGDKCHRHHLALEVLLAPAQYVTWSNVITRCFRSHITACLDSLAKPDG